MASSRIDWDTALCFECGAEAVLHGTLYPTGKLSFAANGESSYAECWAEIFEQGASRVVRARGSGHLLFYDEFGRGIPVDSSEIVPGMGLPAGLPNVRVAAATARVVNATMDRRADLPELEAIPGWGTF